MTTRILVFILLAVVQFDFGHQFQCMKYILNKYLCVPVLTNIKALSASDAHFGSASEYNNNVNSRAVCYQYQV